MRFKTTIGLTLVLTLLGAVFCTLGYWQLQRKAEKEELYRNHEQAAEMALEVARSQSARFARVSATGRYDPERHLLLDNRINQGRAGVEVLSLFAPESGEPILVNRGWLPMPPDRKTLPGISTPAGVIEIHGMLNRPPETGPRLGELEIPETVDWPLLITWFDEAVAAKALGMDSPEWVIQLDPSDSSGFEGRDWKPAIMPPETHGAYALQWFSLALAALIIWIVIGVRRAS